MKKLLIKFLPFSLIRFLSNLKKCNDFYFVPSYSQEGEDMIIKEIFHGKKNGFFIDIGAHHPKLFSNTYYLYKSGWKGINIDAMPGSMALFKKDRPRDINLEIAVSDKQEILTYYAFNEPALNTFSKELAEERMGIPKFKLLFKKEIATWSLHEILNKYLNVNQVIDFMTIDVEGLDLHVLKSNNWSKFRPTIILIECLGFSFDESSKNPIVSFLHEKNYVFFSKTINTLFFADKNFKYMTY